MIRLLIFLCILSVLSSCDNAKAPDCLKTRGDEVVATVVTEPFSSLSINNEFEVVITAGNTQQVRLTTGANLADEITFEVIDGLLTISNNNSCDWARRYEMPVVEITHPNITNIRQNGGGTIRSNGMLNYPDLTLVSEESSGNFELELSADKLVIVNNDLSNYYIEGSVTNLTVGFFSGDGRFEGANLMAEDVSVFQRGTNDIIVNATESLTGRILATGDLIFVGTRPTILDVSEENRGKLIDKTNE